MDLSLGDKVSLKRSLPFLKTSEPMPMLRPPDLVPLDEIGEIVGLRSKNSFEVKFRRGKFLIPGDCLEIKQ